MSAPSHYVAILGSTNKAEIHVLEIGFPSCWLLIRKIYRVVQITAAYVSARENTAMHIRTFGDSSITAAYVPARENTAYSIPPSTKLNIGRPNPLH